MSNSLKIERLKSFLSADPYDSFTKFALGLEYIKINDITSAIDYFENIVLTDPNYVGVYYHLGKQYEILSERNKAVEIFLAGIEIANTQNDVHSANELQQALDDLDF